MKVSPRTTGRLGGWVQELYSRPALPCYNSTNAAAANIHRLTIAESPETCA